MLEQRKSAWLNEIDATCHLRRGETRRASHSSIALAQSTLGHTSATIRLETGALRVGDVIHIRGHTTDFRQKVEYLEV
jgi:hypothetical protein